MRSAHLELTFCDSSDEGNSYHARMEIIPDGAEIEAECQTPAHVDHPSSTDYRGGESGNQHGWLTGWILQGVKKVSENLISAKGESANEPVEPESRGGTLPPSPQWGYGVFGAHSEDEETDNDERPSLHSSSTDATVGERNVQIDLKETILQYRRTPEEFYINILLATLKSGTVEVHGDVFSAAAGSSFLVRILLDSGFVIVEDPVVQQIIQSELDQVLSGDPYNDEFVHADQVDYLRCLCNVKSARISREQMTLLRYSGFEFVKLMRDCPHVLQDIPVTRPWLVMVLRVLCYVRWVMIWLGLFVTLFCTAATINVAVYWFTTGGVTQHGYWTILCYVGGFVVNIVVTVIAEKDKIKQYDDAIWLYPSSNLCMIPVIPVYEAALVYTALRYQCTQGHVRYFIIRYDIYNGIGVQLVSHGIFHALPQLIMQIYLCQQDVAVKVGAISATPFWVLLGGTCLSLWMSLCVYVRCIVFSHSCDTFGFAVMAVDSSKTSKQRQRNMPINLVTRLLLYCALHYFICCCLTLMINLLDTDYCSVTTILFHSVWIAVVALCLVLFVSLLAYSPFSRWRPLIALPSIVMEISAFIFVSAYISKWKGTTELRECVFFTSLNIVLSVPKLVAFGCTCLTFLAWLLMLAYEAVTNERISQRLIDSFVML